MAYTYDDVVREAQNAGIYEKFSQRDLAAMQKNPEYGISLLGLLKDVNNATTEEQRLLATETANRLRKSYGVTGSQDSFFDTLRSHIADAAGSTAVDSTADEDTYKTVLDEIVKGREFTYDPEDDPMFDVYAKAYMREGRRATADTLARVAAMTGGRPSSYAVTAAQQAGDYYAAQLANAIPTLRQNAYQEYLADMERKRALLPVLRNTQETTMLPNLTVGNIKGALEDSFDSVISDFSTATGNIFGEANKGADDTENGFTGNDVGDEPEYKIQNTHGDGWVAVNGIGKVTFSELLTLVKTGKVKETIDPITKTVTYRYIAPGDKSLDVL